MRAWLHSYLGWYACLTRLNLMILVACVSYPLTAMMGYAHTVDSHFELYARLYYQLLKLATKVFGTLVSCTVTALFVDRSLNYYISRFSLFKAHISSQSTTITTHTHARTHMYAHHHHRHRHRHHHTHTPIPNSKMPQSSVRAHRLSYNPQTPSPLESRV